MSRERASIGVELWGDADFRDLTAAAQSLWFKLYSHPGLNYCGVVDFHPGRLAALSLEQTPFDVLVAAQELSSKWWIVVDQDTDEVMVRGFLRHDGLLRQPKLSVSAAKAYAGIGSNKIRAVVVHEVQRYQRENPDLPAWNGLQMKALLKQTAVAVQDTETELRLPVGVTPDQPNGDSHDQRYGQRLPQTAPTATPSVTPAPTPAPATATGSHDPKDADRTEQSAQATVLARASALQVDFAKVARALTAQAAEPVADETTMRVISTVIGKAKPRSGDRTGLILTSIRRDWPELSRLVFEEAS